MVPLYFSGTVFTCVHFQKIAQTSNLCDIQYTTEGILSLKSATDLVNADFSQTQKNAQA